MNMLGGIPHQKFCFYHLPTQGRAGIKVGMLIRLQRIYNFWFFHAVVLSFLDVLQSFYSNFIYILGLTYWHSTQCQLLFFACFLHRKKSISNGVQTPRNFLWIFYGPEDIHWARAAPAGCPEGGTTQARPGGLCPPRWPLAPPLYLINSQIFQKKPSEWT